MYKNRLTSVLRNAEKKYYSDKLKLVNGDLKKTWSILKQAMNKNHSNNVKCNTFKDNNVTIDDPNVITNKFNEFFTNVGPSLAKKIPNVHTDSLSFMNGNYVDSLYLNPVTEEEIFKLIKDEKRDKACGFDNISINFVKDVAHHLLKPITCIFNCSLSTGIFPQDLKTARVIPLFKAGDPEVFSNYRPVSILPCFSKLLEKVFHNRLSEYVNVNKMLFNGQYGFRKNCSTTFALLDLMEDITKAIDDKKFTVGLFIDLKKAFDTIDHEILLKKLYFYGVRGTAYNWIESYLSSRFQYCCYNSVSSAKLPISCGVPQGSILGPLLFILYINDMANVSTLLKFIIFADDTNIFYSHKSLVEIQKVMNTELCKLSLWFKCSKLSLNVLKTNFIIFRTKSKKLNMDVNLNIDNIISENKNKAGAIHERNLINLFH